MRYVIFILTYEFIKKGMSELIIYLTFHPLIKYFINLIDLSICPSKVPTRPGGRLRDHPARARESVREPVHLLQAGGRNADQRVHQ